MPRTAVPSRYKERLPKHAQDIYTDAFNKAYEEYRDKSKRRTNESRDAVASKVAWKAVKRKYDKGEDGRWHRTGIIAAAPRPRHKRKGEREWIFSTLSTTNTRKCST